MDYWERRMSLFTPDSELLKNLPKKEEEDTLVKVKEEGVKMPECQLRFFGWEDKEYWEDCWENIDNRERLTNLFIINSTYFLKVINLKTKKF